MSLKDTAKKLITIRKKLSDIEEAVAPIKKERDALQSQIIEEMKAEDQLGIKYQEATISLSVRKTISITDETAAIEFCKKEGFNEYVKERVTDTFKKSLAPTHAKHGNPIPGTEMKEKEYISVRMSKKEERRK